MRSWKPSLGIVYGECTTRRVYWALPPKGKLSGLLTPTAAAVRLTAVYSSPVSSGCISEQTLLDCSTGTLEQNPTVRQAEMSASKSDRSHSGSSWLVFAVRRRRWSARRCSWTRGLDLARRSCVRSWQPIRRAYVRNKSVIYERSADVKYRCLQ
ncbi:hypothetical protein KC362_g73 [Hortaea werneckii]|nr:hypothetical protein KC362_g73 [Hortaea werneckii]